MTENKNISFIERLKNKALSNKKYMQENEKQEAKIENIICPNCSGSRDVNSALTHCPYCNYEFIKTILTDGINIKSSNNFKK